MLDSLAPARRRLFLGVAVLVVLGVVAALVAVLVQRRAAEVDPVPQDELGPVLLVTGYGGANGGLEELAGSLAIGGRRTLVVRPSDPTGDLREQAAELGEVVDRALAAGAPSVDVVGYSAGGLVARWWAAELGGASQARRVVTLASPHDGTAVAELAQEAAGAACPTACQQLVPGSDFLRRLAADGLPPGPVWAAVWTEDDDTVVPPDSGALEEAVLSYSLQSVCPDVVVPHAAVPGAPVVAAAVEAAVGIPPPSRPDPSVCS